jgi:A/G-specific adenine glycosylase
MTPTEFQKKLYTWHQSISKREMPWVGEKDPYKIWLSEIILQQTRVEQGRDYYLRFVNTYPTVSDLANAPEDDVLRLWQGLGYYSRARNLHYSAKYIVENHEGLFPNTYNDLLKLKGVGEYTASAIVSFAYDLPYAVVDGNVYRILARIFGIKDFLDETEVQKKIKLIAQDLLDKRNPAKYNQAIMDFGAQGCIPANPICTDCLLSIKCIAFKENIVSEIPKKKKKIIKKDRYFIFKIHCSEDKIAIEKRGGNDIWEGLYQLPLEEVNLEFFDKIANENNSKIYSQTLTHQKIKAIFVELDFCPSTLEFISIKDLKKFGFPKIISTFIDETFY